MIPDTGRQQLQFAATEVQVQQDGSGQMMIIPAANQWVITNQGNGGIVAATDSHVTDVPVALNGIIILLLYQQHFYSFQFSSSRDQQLWIPGEWLTVCHLRDLHQFRHLAVFTYYFQLLLHQSQQALNCYHQHGNYEVYYQ
ncbi:hypothetical protein A6R68_20606 [Neotoma lepida]|uniref:Uncharacterized protein n=1 Tax=Neotoma lepida TaxID=56216 RepID=A0A1A6HT74_NEOLE|nr:hypothetical protein A6R68_20606 [Neotoma lepida]